MGFQLSGIKNLIFIEFTFLLAFGTGLGGNFLVICSIAIIYLYKNK